MFTSSHFKKQQILSDLALFGFDDNIHANTLPLTLPPPFSKPSLSSISSFSIPSPLPLAPRRRCRPSHRSPYRRLCRSLPRRRRRRAPMFLCKATVPRPIRLNHSFYVIDVINADGVAISSGVSHTQARILPSTGLFPCSTKP